MLAQAQPAAHHESAAIREPEAACRIAFHSEDFVGLLLVGVGGAVDVGVVHKLRVHSEAGVCRESDRGHEQQQGTNRGQEIRQRW